MVIKKADDKKPQIDELRLLLGRPDLKLENVRRIDREIRKIRSGILGEKEAAYYINQEFSASKHWAVIHDLRLELKGESAQIDHLVINRLMEIWVCESKRFSESISINEQGECSSFYKGTQRGVQSPLTQNKHHVRFLERFFAAGAVKLPTRLGFAIKPSIKSVVLITTCSIIERPKSKVPGITTLIKNDQFGNYIDRTITRSGNPIKAIGRDTLEQFARSLAAAHRPSKINWDSRFGLSTKPRSTPNLLLCANCGARVSNRVANYCRGLALKLDRKIYCFKCQQGILPSSSDRV